MLGCVGLGCVEGLLDKRLVKLGLVGLGWVEVEVKWVGFGQLGVSGSRWFRVGLGGWVGVGVGCALGCAGRVGSLGWVLGCVWVCGSTSCVACYVLCVVACCSFAQV